MATTLTLKANEGSTYVITATFKDEALATVDLSNSTYSLLDQNGAVVNSIEDKSFTSSGGEYDFVFTGADLYIGTQATERTLYIVGQYDSSLGNGLYLRDNVTFTITDLLGV